jgi:hypothetical protein
MIAGREAQHCVPLHTEEFLDSPVRTGTPDVCSLTSPQLTVNAYRRTTQISTRPTTAETMPTIRRTLSGVASALFIARRIQAGLAANISPSSTKRMPTPMRKSVNAMDLIG